MGLPQAPPRPTPRSCIPEALGLPGLFLVLLQNRRSHLNRITKFIQKTQRERGKAFVSRTRLEPARYYHFPCIVFRVVLANPLTTPDILEDILREQRELSKEDDD